MSHADILIALRIKGFAKAEVLAECLGLPLAQVEATLAAMETKGQISMTKLGPKLTPDGQKQADAASAREREAAAPGDIANAYEAFNAINGPFKALITDWQTREVDGERVPNDHSDTAYDAAVTSQLNGIHQRACAVCAQLTRLAPRMGQYQRRFQAALDKITAGESRFFAGPIIDSYHTVWFELHEDIIRLSGKTRAQEALAGKAV